MKSQTPAVKENLSALERVLLKEALTSCRKDRPLLLEAQDIVEQPLYLTLMRFSADQAERLTTGGTLRMLQSTSSSE